MGIKATNFLLYSLSILFTFIFSIITILSASSGHYAPSENIIITFIGLSLPILLLLNIIICIYWLCRKRIFIALIPIFTILLCYNHYSKIYKFAHKLNTNEEAEKSRPNNIKILSYNIHYYGNKDFIIQGKEIYKFLEQQNIDIACFQEYGDSNSKQKYSNKILNKKFPYKIVNRNSDLAVISRFPIISTKIKSFPSSEYGYIICNIALCNSSDSTTIANAKKINIISTHLQSTGVNRSIDYSNKIKNTTEAINKVDLARLIIQQMSTGYRMRENQINEITTEINRLKQPLILCGDFNDTPQSYVYNKVALQLKDSFKEAGYSYMYTYKYMLKLLRIDYIFNSYEFTVNKFYTIDLPWSDHNPVIAEFEI